MALALLSLAGCAIFEALKTGDQPLAFSHAVHVGDQGLDCVACHAQAESGDEPGMPGPQGCALCHAEIDAKKPPERQIAALYDGKTYRAQHVLALADEVRFSHAKHVERAQDCAACHDALAKSDRVEPAHALRMDDCTACHAAKPASNDCATCHERIRADAQPPSHVASWMRSHGGVVRACEREETANRCDLCHTETSCQTCHLAQAPENHKGFWRERGHGLTASMDRQNCAACHQPDSCDRCHQENAPRSHRGTWGAPQDRHCVSCHEPLAGESCATCHQATPSHDAATPMPAWHIPAMNCRQCHGNGQPLPHIDDGSSCTRCHL
ncbi:MAG: cytochrome c3 family protein [Planctomycetes bacterium]|nr:cytochrome c3 family protein [Planctomycetota bacterium]